MHLTLILGKRTALLSGLKLSCMDTVRRICTRKRRKRLIIILLNRSKFVAMISSYSENKIKKFENEIRMVITDATQPPRWPWPPNFTNIIVYGLIIYVCFESSCIMQVSIESIVQRFIERKVTISYFRAPL